MLVKFPLNSNISITPMALNQQVGIFLIFAGYFIEQQTCIRELFTMDYHFREIEQKWQAFWQSEKTFTADNHSGKPKYYVLDMFPYPSGAGLHVGHPLGYIASDIYSRYKWLQGFNVLHPMGFDAFGLPAEQYAIQTGQHPALTTEENIAQYKRQLTRLGFAYDWDREVRTSDPFYYKWTQWAFLKMFNAWYDNAAGKARPLEELVEWFSKNGSAGLPAARSAGADDFSATQWNAMTEREQQERLMDYRIAYLADTMVNWCPALGTVLANDEVKDGLSERGGHPVIRKSMKQWSLRISAYAHRLLESLDSLDWSDSAKEIQRNWIGRSEGAIMRFSVLGADLDFEVFTTRPDTIFGCSFMVLAPESELVKPLTTDEQKVAVEAYVKEAVNRTDRERMAEVKKVTGVFTGSYARHPFTGDPIPIWVADYVLAGYGTGAIMAVPAHDTRDYAFAKHFNLPVKQVIDGDISEGAFDSKDALVINSDFITGLRVPEAIKTMNARLEELGIGYGKVNFRLRDAIFSRQRYWGEPFPIFYKDGLPYPLDEDQLPLELPEVDAYLPTVHGDPPLGRAAGWHTADGYPFELSTMPGFAGSSAYYLRYMDPLNDQDLVSKEANDYWQDVDLYIGGMEHATGHLIYARFWNKFLFDLGFTCKDEPFRKLINQGMIQGRSSLVYRINGTNTFVSLGLKDQHDVTPLHVDVNLVVNDQLNPDQFKAWRPEFASAQFILESGVYHCGYEIEKMSKRFHNVVNPDDLADRYGADTLRMYEMFLGPLEQHKPWDTNGIEGVYRFIRKFWKLFFNGQQQFELSEEAPSQAELKTLHKTIKKVKEDIERFAFNTAVSTFMICVNELGDLKCNKRAILEPLTILVSPYAPHIAEELWQKSGHSSSVAKATFPEFNPDFLVEDIFEYPVSFNGKTRFKLACPTSATREEVEASVRAHEQTEKYLAGGAIKKVIVVPGRIINVVY
jgi:leucyl-tRNA synthetase